jgi:cytochrome c oxidase subunit IV
MATESEKSTGITTYLVVYVCMLAIAALQFLVAYENIDGSQMFGRMLALAIAEAGLAVFFFMHLWTERHRLILFVSLLTVFVIAMMQMIWTDSFRLLVFRLGK